MSQPTSESRSARQHGSLTPTPTRRDPARPKRIGAYRPQSVLGAGGMATVYLAAGGARLGSRRWCALKVLHEKLNDREHYLSMFLNEARIASEICHPHVCSVFDYGCINGQAYLAMDFLHGKSLASVGRACSKADPEQHALRVARILTDTCEGLSAIHEFSTLSEGQLNVVHRDISPDNLILGFDGFVKVIDFGLAKVACRGDKTQSGILKGKISYIAPELLSGHTATPSADIWSLGVVAWELLTGSRLFRKATDAETLRAITEQPIAAPSTVLAGLPTELDAIVLRALERDPALRYASAADFSADLWNFLRSRASFPQHRELGAWLEQLFPGEHEQILRRLESAPASAPDEGESRQAQRSLRLLNGLRGRVRGALPTRPRGRILASALVAAAVVGLGLFHWGSASPHGFFGAFTAASLARPAVAQAEPMQPRSAARDSAASGFVVEVERSPHSSEVVVHVRATPPSDQLSASR
jgi:eukaryotic-like serine/threonine-protein kinase